MTRPAIFMAALTAILFMASLSIGASAIPVSDGLATLLTGSDPLTTTIMREIRLPRALLGLSIGFSLGLGGAALQGFLRNPLAEPGLIGISGAAALGAVIVFYTGLSTLGGLTIQLGALIGASMAVLFLMSMAGRRASPMTLILAGVALTSLTGALTALALNLSPNPFASYEIIFWLLGSLKDRALGDVALAVPMMAAGCILLFKSASALDALSLGEETARSLGINLKSTAWLIILGVALSAGAGVAVAGTIGFVGLVMPHIIRPFTDRRPSSLLLASGFGGAALLLAADIAVRLLGTGRELNVGVLTAMIGAPFFLWLVLSKRKLMT